MSHLHGMIEAYPIGSCSVEQMHVILQAAGVPTVPGSDGLVRNPEEAFRVAKEVIPNSQ